MYTGLRFHKSNTFTASSKAFIIGWGERALMEKQIFWKINRPLGEVCLGVVWRLLISKDKSQSAPLLQERGLKTTEFFRRLYFQVEKGFWKLKCLLLKIMYATVACSGPLSAIVLICARRPAF